MMEFVFEQNEYDHFMRVVKERDAELYELILKKTEVKNGKKVLRGTADELYDIGDKVLDYSTEMMVIEEDGDCTGYTADGSILDLIGCQLVDFI